MTKSRAKKNRENSMPPASRKTAVQAVPMPRESGSGGLTLWLAAKLVRLPRLARVVLAGVMALGVTGAIFPLVDLIYIQYFFTPETGIIPSFISSGIGLVFYMAGWYLMVGSSGENQVSSHPALVIYFVIGVAAVCLDIALIIQGYSMTDAISG
jgi:hypothetical protein